MRIAGIWLRVTLFSARCFESHFEQKKAESFSRIVLSAKIFIQESSSIGSLGAFLIGLAGSTAVVTAVVEGADTTSC